MCPLGLSKPPDEAGDLVPGFTDDHGFAFLDLGRLQIHMYRGSIHRHGEPGRVRMSLRAAGLTPYGLKADPGAVEFLPDVSGDFELAFFERGEWHLIPGAC